MNRLQINPSGYEFFQALRERTRFVWQFVLFRGGFLVRDLRFIQGFLGSPGILRNQFPLAPAAVPSEREHSPSHSLALLRLLPPCLAKAGGTRSSLRKVSAGPQEDGWR
jgi:hypothetical protein